MAITTGSANQRPNTPCIRLWIDVTFQGLKDSYSTETARHKHSPFIGLKLPLGICL